METPGKRSFTRYIGPAIAALLVLFVSVVLWYFPNEYAYRLQGSREHNLNPTNGVWDLTIFDLNNEIVFIEGSVEYVLGELLTPEEFDSYGGEIYYGRVPDDVQVATARLRFIFPDDEVYTLASNSAEYNERVYVNGQWRHDIAAPGLTAAESKAGNGFTVFDIMPQDGIVEVVRQSSNFVHKEGGGYTGYYIGNPANIRQMAATSQLFIAIQVGLYLCLFLLHMVLYLMVRDYRPNLWFALICFAWLFRAGFTGRFIYWAMFPDIPWTLTYRLGCISIGFTGVMLLLMVQDEFPGVVQKWPLHVFIAAQVPFTIFYLIAGTEQSSRVKVASEVMLCAAAAYLLVRFAIVLPKRARQKKLLPEQLISLAGLAVAIFALIHDAVRYNNWLPGIFYYEIGDVGVMILVLFQMTAMILGTLSVEIQ